MRVCLTQRAERMIINDDYYAACWMNVKQAHESVMALEGGDNHV